MKIIKSVKNHMKDTKYNLKNNLRGEGRKRNHLKVHLNY